MVVAAVAVVVAVTVATATMVAAVATTLINMNQHEQLCVCGRLFLTKIMEHDLLFAMCQTHSIHVWYIYQHLPQKATIDVGEYTYMDAMGNDVFNLDSYTIVLDLQVNKNHLSVSC